MSGIGEQARFLREGGTTLFPEELELLGAVDGHRLLYLKCQQGHGALSLARLGATVTGIDADESVIASARQLSQDADISATFDVAKACDWLAESSRSAQFDIVFCSYGVFWSLSELRSWARGVANVLAPGGRLVCVDFHPTALMFDEHWQPVYPYTTRGRPLKLERRVHEYVIPSGLAVALDEYREEMQALPNPTPVLEYFWGLGEILSALLEAGLQLDVFREYDYVNGSRLFVEMQAAEEHRWLPPDHVPNIPLMFGLVADKPAGATPSSAFVEAPRGAV